MYRQMYGSDKKKKLNLAIQSQKHKYYLSIWILDLNLSIRVFKSESLEKSWS